MSRLSGLGQAQSPTGLVTLSSQTSTVAEHLSNVLNALIEVEMSLGISVPPQQVQSVSKSKDGPIALSLPERLSALVQAAVEISERILHIRNVL